MKAQKNGAAARRKFSRLERGGFSPNARTGTGVNFGNRRLDLEQAIQRYADLFDFAPVAYVSFDRVGRIQEINVAACELFGRSRRLLIGCPISVFVDHRDTHLLLEHLRRCKSATGSVETELRLRNGRKEIISVRLSSTLTASSMRDGVLLYQTAFIDLTERKRAEEAIRISEERYRSLFELVPVAVFACDAEGVILEYNRRAVELWGRAPVAHDEKFCGSHKIYYPDGRPMPHEECPLARTLRNKPLNPEELEIIVERANGERLHAISSPRVLRSEKGEIVGAINCLFDITDRKQAEIALAEAARQREALYEFVQRRQEAETLREICKTGVDAVLAAIKCDRAAVLLLDADNKMRFIASRHLSRRYRNAVEGHSPWKPGARNPQPLCMTEIAKRPDVPVELKKAVRRERISAAAFIPLIGRGKLTGKFVIYYDAPHHLTDNELSLALTIAGQLALGIERKRASNAVRESEELHRALVRQTAVGMARTNLQGRFMFANHNFCEILGYTEAELLGKTIADITHPDDLADSERSFRHLARTGKAYRLDKRYIRKDGSVIWVSISASPMSNASGKINAAVAVVLDINQSKQAELALAEAKASLESRVKQRTAEIAAANKQLQSEIALRKRLEGEILEVSDREQRRLGQDLHDSLCQNLAATAFMARAMAVRLKDHRVVNHTDLEKIAELINAGVTEARMIARGLHPVEMDEAGLTMALQSLLHRQSKLPYRLDLDETLTITDPTISLNLYRIAREAVINANKHSRARELTVSMRRAGKQLELSVEDNGVGLKNKNRNSQANRATGTGMGFHIMEYRARSIGARLEIGPAKPRGTRVACFLPLKK